MAENKLADLSTDFAVKILKLTDGMKGHYSLTAGKNLYAVAEYIPYSQYK